MKLLSFPQIRGKIMSEYEVLFDDDKNPAAYGLNITTELPEWVVKQVYNLALKPRLKVSFEQGMPDGTAVQVPKEFFSQKNGIVSWEETLLTAEKDIFNKVGLEKHWFFISKRLNSMSITRRGDRSVVFFEILGEKSEKQ